MRSSLSPAGDMLLPSTRMPLSLEEDMHISHVYIFLTDASTTTAPLANASMVPTAVPSSAPMPLVSPLVAAYLIVVVVVSVVANFLVVVVRVCGRRRPVRSSHVCTLCLAASDMTFSLTVHTLMILAALGVDPLLLFNTAGCNYYGFSAMFFGTFSMCIHATVSLIRYINICHAEKVEWLKLKYVYILICGSALYSVVWAMGPLLSWGRYETFEFGCTLAFSDPSHSGRSFVTCAFFFVLLLPLGVVVTCYSLIILKTHKYQREICRIAGHRETLTERRRERKAGGGGDLLPHLRLHNKLVRMSMVVAVGYVLGWLPYAIVCMWATYGDYSTIPIEVRVGASLICKSATAYNPFIYYFMSEGFRADLRWLGHRAGLVSYPGLTYHSSFRSSSRSSMKKSSRDRTREDSLIHNSGFLTLANQDTRSTLISPLTSPDASDDRAVYALPGSLPGGQSRISNCLSRSSLQHCNLTRRFADASVRSSCRRSVSFSISPKGSPQAVRSPLERATSEREAVKTTRSCSLFSSDRATCLWGHQGNKRLEKHRWRKASRDEVCMNTGV